MLLGKGVYCLNVQSPKFEENIVGAMQEAPEMQAVTPEMVKLMLVMTMEAQKKQTTLKVEQCDISGDVSKTSESSSGSSSRHVRPPLVLPPDADDKKEDDPGRERSPRGVQTK